MGTPKNHHDEAIPMGTNNIGSYEKETKLSLNYNQIHLII